MSKVVPVTAPAPRQQSEDGEGTRCTAGRAVHEAEEKRKNKNKRNDSIHSIWAILFSSLLIVEHRLRSGCHAVGWVFSGASRSMKTREFRLFVSALSSAELNKYCCLLRRRAAKVSAAVTHHHLAAELDGHIRIHLGLREEFEGHGGLL